MELTSRSPWPARRDWLLDGAVLLALVLLTWLLPALLPAGVPRAGPLVGGAGFLVVACVMFATVPLPLDRRPIAALIIATVAATGLVGWALSAPGYLTTADDPANLLMPLAPVFPTYTAILYHHDRRRAWLVVVLAALIVVRPWSTSLTAAASGLSYVTAPMLVGLYLAARRMLVVTLTDRAERAERERDLRAERARAEERVRLAAELHDIVTHRISLMVLHAGALRVTATDDETKEAAEEIRSTGGQALEELRDLIGVLRSPRTSSPQEPGNGAETDRAGAPS